jgi:uncharacterized protein (DUF302 family)
MTDRRSMLESLVAIVACNFGGTNAQASTRMEDGLITLASNHSVKETLDRLETSLKAKGGTIFARIDHASGGASVGMALRPTELLIFGNPKTGTPLMQSNQTIGIDLPMKFLGWQDADGKNWLTYNDFHWLARRHQLAPSTAAAVDALVNALANVAEAAVA